MHATEIFVKSKSSYSGPYFPAFGLNTERYTISLRIQSECGKILTRITPNTDTFYALFLYDLELLPRVFFLEFSNDFQCSYSVKPEDNSFLKVLSTSCCKF